MIEGAYSTFSLAPICHPRERGDLNECNLVHWIPTFRDDYIIIHHREKIRRFIRNTFYVMRHTLYVLHYMSFILHL